MLAWLGLLVWADSARGAGAAVPGHEPASAPVNRVLVLDNLLSNAIKYSPPGKSIEVRLFRAGEAARCAVRDEGPGLTEDDRRKLFGKFARLSARPTAGEQSTGLGLSIVKRLVEAMRGRVWCESEPGHGATFLVEFPAVEPGVSSPASP